METTAILNSRADLTKERNPWIRRWKQFVRSFEQRRASERVLCGVVVKIWWTDEHGDGTAQGVCVDRSEGGFGVICTKLLPSQTCLHLQLEHDRTVNRVALRHCQQLCSAYMMGLQFVHAGAHSESDLIECDLPPVSHTNTAAG